MSRKNVTQKLKGGCHSPEWTIMNFLKISHYTLSTHLEIIYYSNSLKTISSKT